MVEMNLGVASLGVLRGEQARKEMKTGHTNIHPCKMPTGAG